MGATLVRYYEYIEKVAGREGKVKLAQQTRVASVIAAGAKEDPEVIRRFREAITTITGKPPPF